VGLTGMRAKMLGAPPFGVGTDVAVDVWEGCGEIVGAVGFVTLRPGGSSTSRWKMVSSTSGSVSAHFL